MTGPTLGALHRPAAHQPEERQEEDGRIAGPGVERLPLAAFHDVLENGGRPERTAPEAFPEAEKTAL